MHRLHAAHWPRGAPREAHYPFGEAPLTDYLRRHARERPQQTANVFYGRECLKLGCVHVPVNPLFKQFELTYELDDSGAVALVALDTLMPLVRPSMAETKVRKVFVTSFAEVLPDAPAFPIPPSRTAQRLSRRRRSAAGAGGM